MSVHKFRPKAGEATEKITINLGVVDHGQIDLLVQEGLYSNRTDLIQHVLAAHQSCARPLLEIPTFSGKITGGKPSLICLEQSTVIVE